MLFIASSLLATSGSSQTLLPPDAATLISPTGTITTTTPPYTWNAVSAATWYYLWVNDRTGTKFKQWYRATDVGCGAGTGTCSVTPGTALAFGAGQWWIQTWNSTGYGPWSNGMTFDVSPPLPGVATLVAPAGAISTATPTYTWNAVSESTWYYLWVNDSTGTKFKQWYRATDVGCGAGTGTCSVTPGTALAFGAGQWWIQTWNSTGYGPWSNGMTFDVSPPLPGVATLVAPAGAINTATPTYTWNAVSVATWYYLWVNDRTGTKFKQWYRATDVGCGTGTGTCSVTPSTALADGDGQWWIQTWNPSGYGPWSDGMTMTFTTCTPAQQWCGILDPSRAIDWSQAGVVGGIPNRTTICATLNPGATATQINNAIQTCPANQVVFLNAGTYNLSSAITFNGKSNVTLRGAGPDQTFLVFTDNIGCIFSATICVIGSTSIYGGDVGAVPSNQITDWTGGLAKGSTQLTVSSTVGMEMNQILVLDQMDDTEDTGGIVNSAAVPLFANEGGPPGRHDTWPFRSQMQFVQVVSVDDATHVTITPPVYMPNWRASQQPQVWWWGTAAQTAYYDGVENLSVDSSASDASYGIALSNSYNCWVKNTRGIKASRGHVGFVQSARNEVRDNYFYGSLNSGAVSYGVENFATSSNLTINNIFQHVAGPTVGPSPGYVYAFNFMTDIFFAPGTFNFLAMFASHDSGGGMELFEGNQTNGWITDFPHGNSPLMTVFRNHLKGLDDVPRQENQIPVVIESWSRANNFVGNVLGTAGFHTVYENSLGPQGNSSDEDHTIYTLGYGGSGVPNDIMVVTSLLRWGNYDPVTGATRFNSAEVPTTGITFINGNPVPASQVLPASFFLLARPSWWTTTWGTPAWPPIGPDVTGGNVAGYGGRVYKIPAQLCFENTPIDTDSAYSSLNVRLFNAAACYFNDSP